jgi:hypothetical protein
MPDEGQRYGGPVTLLVHTVERSVDVRVNLSLSCYEGIRHDVRMSPPLYGGGRGGDRVLSMFHVACVPDALIETHLSRSGLSMFHVSGVCFIGVYFMIH